MHFLVSSFSQTNSFTDKNKTEGDKTGERASDLNGPGRLISAWQRTLSNQSKCPASGSFLESSFARKADQVKSPKMKQKIFSQGVAKKGQQKIKFKSHCILDWQLTLWESYHRGYVHSYKNQTLHLTWKRDEKIYKCTNCDSRVICEIFSISPKKHALNKK